MIAYSKMSSLQKDKVLDRRISYAEIKKCSKSLKNNKTGGNDGLVGELFKCGGKEMANLLKVLYEVVWTEESEKANKDFYENRKEFWSFVNWQSFKG